VIILFKQKVEIATLPSVARNDITLLEVTTHQQVARDDNLLKKRSSDLLTQSVKNADDKIFTLNMKDKEKLNKKIPLKHIYLAYE